MGHSRSARRSVEICRIIRNPFFDAPFAPAALTAQLLLTADPTAETRPSVGVHDGPTGSRGVGNARCRRPPSPCLAVGPPQATLTRSDAIPVQSALRRDAGG